MQTIEITNPIYTESITLAIKDSPLMKSIDH